MTSKKENKDTSKNIKFNKNIIIIALVVIVAVITGLFLGMGKKDNKKDLEKSLQEMGRTFYENFYYEQVGSSADERTSLLSKFTTVGIKIDLDNLGRYNDNEFKDEISKFKNTKTDKKCNKTNTKVIIYPKSPYGKTDYTIKTELDCGFDDKK